MSWVLRFMLGCLSIANLVHLVIDLEHADLLETELIRVKGWK